MGRKGEELIILIGFKGSGKSTVGKIVGEKLQSPFADTDDLLQTIYQEREREALTFREIFQKHGREFFAALETESLKRALDQKNRVISLGGGTLLIAPKTGLDFSEALYINLEVEKETLYNRIMEGGIPAFFDPNDPRSSFDEYYASRHPVYEQYADITIDNSSRTPEETADAIVAALASGVRNEG